MKKPKTISVKKKESVRRPSLLCAEMSHHALGRGGVSQLMSDVAALGWDPAATRLSHHTRLTGATGNGSAGVWVPVTCDLTLTAAAAAGEPKGTA